MSTQTIQGVLTAMFEPLLRRVVREELRSNGHLNGKAAKVSSTPVAATPKGRKAQAAAPTPVVAKGKRKFGEKSELIRSMPNATVAEVVAAAAAKGIKLTPNHVYNVRSSEKKNGGKAAKSAAKAAKAPKAAKAASKPAKAPKAAKKAKAAESKVSEGRRAVARGDRPKLVDAIAIVMGKETMDVSGVIEGLAKRKWTPKASKLPAYISYMLSSNMDTVFDRPARGKYKVIDPEKYAKLAKGSPSGKGEGVASEESSAGTEERAEKPAAKPRKKAEKPAVSTETSSEATASTPASDPSETAAVAAESEPEAAPESVAPPPNGTTDQDLADLGIGTSAVGANPFGESASLS